MLNCNEFDPGTNSPGLRRRDPHLDRGRSREHSGGGALLAPKRESGLPRMSGVKETSRGKGISR